MFCLQLVIYDLVRGSPDAARVKTLSHWKPGPCRHEATGKAKGWQLENIPNAALFVQTSSRAQIYQVTKELRQKEYELQTSGINCVLQI